MKELGSPVINVTVKKDTFRKFVPLNVEFWRVAVVVYIVGVGERDWDTKGPGSRSGLDPGLQFTFFLIETLNKSIRAQKFSKCP